MTFKKLNFSEKSGSEESKQAVIVQRQLQFDVEPQPFDGRETGELPKEEIVNLQECEVCGRKFNLESYQKHIRVC